MLSNFRYNDSPVDAVSATEQCFPYPLFIPTLPEYKMDSSPEDTPGRLGTAEASVSSDTPRRSVHFEPPPPSDPAAPPPAYDPEANDDDYRTAPPPTYSPEDDMEAPPPVYSGPEAEGPHSDSQHRNGDT